MNTQSQPVGAAERNIADSLAEFLPKPTVVHDESLEPGGGFVSHVGLPKGWQLQKLDNEELLDHPRRTKASAGMGDDASFVAYVKRHAQERSLVWCQFDPARSILSFAAVFDEHHTKPGWRSHRAVFTPEQSQEWKTWTQHNKQAKSQVAFAEFIEQNEQDIAAIDGHPSSLQMMQMASEFEARQDQRLRSSVRLQSGGIQLEYVADPDKGTTERMRAFDRFAIGIPVFWSLPTAEGPVVAYTIKARLRYRLGDGKVTFWYDLIRPDLVHQAASMALIQRIAAGIAPVPLVMGECK